MLAEVKTTDGQDLGQEPLILAGVVMYDKDDEPLGPEYSVAEVSQFFFSRTAHWMRWLEKKDWLNYTYRDGTMEKLEPKRSRANARTYDLAIVERIAHGLSQAGRIDAYQLLYAVNLVRIQAEMHGLVQPRHPVFARLFTGTLMGIGIDMLIEHKEDRRKIFPIHVGSAGGLYTFDPMRVQVKNGPQFTPLKVAKVFFDRSVNWMERRNYVEIPVSLYPLDFQPRRVRVKEVPPIEEEEPLVEADPIEELTEETPVDPVESPPAQVIVKKSPPRRPLVVTTAKKIDTIPLADAVPTDANAVRTYDLSLIERIAVGFFLNGDITALQLNRALDTIRIQALMAEIL